MPLWKVYHPVGAFAADDKRALAERIMALYSKHMPAFYVGVIFEEVAAASFYIGGNRMTASSGSGSITSRANSPTTNMRAASSMW
nr:tautomerase family protein [Sphingomonas aliaeris]